MPGPCGPVPVARSRWPGPGGPVLVDRSRYRFRARPVFAVARWPGPGPGPGPGPCHLSCPWSGFGGPDLFQENGGSTLFSKPLVRGKQYCEVGTIIEQKQEPNGCQSQLPDMKTLDVASWAAVSVCSRNTNVTMVWAWMFL